MAYLKEKVKEPILDKRPESYFYEGKNFLDKYKKKNKKDKVSSKKMTKYAQLEMPKYK